MRDPINFRVNLSIRLVLIILLFLLSQCKKDYIQDSVTPSITLGSQNDVSLATSVISVPYDVSKSLPANFVKNGTKDYTTYLQSALNKYTNIVFPAFPILVNATGLKILSNTTITFLAGSKLLLVPNNLPNYSVIRIYNVSNVVLNNPVIIGDRYAHSSIDGQWGQGITISGSKNIILNAPNITNCWGDGIYLSSIDTLNNHNITINNAYCRSNRRNGISVTSAVGLTLESPYAGYSDGSPPSAGIDFEAESSADQLQKIVINNARTEYNTGNGITMGFRSLFGGRNKFIGFQLNNCMDKGSAIGLNATATLTRRVGNETVTGDIKVINPYWRKNTNTPLATNLLVTTIRLNVVNPIVQDITGQQLTDAQALAIFTYKTHINRTANYTITF
ncbi:hypothetical protein [Mucilaginibacter panaciglaebae]|uniref:Parallel beta helix pectate lyase-like protein n=1 Tax=Mucilaginibacter panaciglaebae TaxID=502331 RepID=A0ABP7WEN9_9SPHI